MAPGNTDLQFLLIPGFGGTGRLLRHLAALFPEGTEVTIARYPAAADSVAELSAAVAEFVSDWSRTVVISESMGSLVAVDLCRRFSSSPRAAVFCAAFARSPRPALIQLGLALPSAFLYWLATLRLSFRMAGTTGNGELANTLQSVTGEMGAVTFRQRLKIIGGTDLRGLLPALAMPSLYLQASADRLVPACASDEFCSLLPGIRRTRVAGPHFLLQAAPRACLREIEAFLAGLDSPVSGPVPQTSSR
jgi:pimeloyl-[acyl-carrier protein] methyl ester esterase